MVEKLKSYYYFDLHTGEKCIRVVIKSRGPGIFSGYFYWKIEEK